MAEIQNASFIPKKTHKPHKRVRTARRIYIFSYLSYVLFFGTLIAVAATLFYVDRTDRVLQEKKEALVQQRNTYNQTDMDRIRGMERRLIVAQDLVESLHAPSRIFTSLEESVISPVQLIRFEYVQEIKDLFHLKFSANIGSFDEALFQRDIVANNPILKNAETLDFDYSAGLEDTDGEIDLATQLSEEDTTIIFTFEGTIRDSTIPYDSSVYTGAIASRPRPQNDISDSFAVATSTEGFATTTNQNNENNE